ncbi:transposition helper protein [Rhodococcus wratislaviensis IFP 2016]|uniref:Transposition helper protein n=1 Tax=Rhodococcus opacus M213 TaxID=1129896 RepID=K8XPL2_RHOOP|nr:transposition helper protein [Rhodococcus opacus M213]ELB95128.1 transposition helper protein [Rhodococcus wratislaviensis IFP 2016]
MSTAPPSAPPLPADLETLLHRLQLPHIRRAAPDVLATARAQRWEPAEVLKALLAEEAAGRERSALATRRATAAFPTGKTFDAWKPELSSIPAPTQQALRTLEWIERRENLVVCGPGQVPCPSVGRTECPLMRCRSGPPPLSWVPANAGGVTSTRWRRPLERV